MHHRTINHELRSRSQYRCHQATACPEARCCQNPRPSTSAPTRRQGIGSVTVISGTQSCVLDGSRVQTTCVPYSPCFPDDAVLESDQVFALREDRNMTSGSTPAPVEFPSPTSIISSSRETNILRTSGWRQIGGGIRRRRMTEPSHSVVVALSIVQINPLVRSPTKCLENPKQCTRGPQRS